MAPVLEGLVRTSGGTVTLAKVNVDQQPGLAARYGIHSSGHPPGAADRDPIDEGALLDAYSLSRSSAPSVPRW